MKIVVSFKKRTISIYDQYGYYNGGSTMPLNTKRKIFKALINSYTLEYKRSTVIYSRSHANLCRLVTV
jgi:hypothetical protein